MTTRKQEVQLKSFSSSNQSNNLNLSVTVERHGSRLVLNYELRGELEKVLFPAQGRTHSRANLLWAHTCFELFLALETGPFYWELNASPSGDWNFYRLDKYREGLRPEEKVMDVDHEVLISRTDQWLSQVSVDLSALLPSSDAPLFLGPAVVVEHLDVSQSYWALSHLDSKPDFHIRDSFSLRI